MSRTELPAGALVNFIDDEYTKDAHRTLVPGKLHSENVGAYYLYDTLAYFTDAGARLDRIKKAVIYNKQDTEIQPVGGEPTLLQANRFDRIEADIFHSILGIATEASELVEALLTAIKTGKPLDRVNLKEEMGDVMWYMVVGARKAGFTVGEACHTNIEKLKLRFPEKFSDSDALNRDTSAERELLEKHTRG